MHRTKHPVIPTWLIELPLERTTRGLEGEIDPQREMEKWKRFRERQWKLSVSHALWQYRHAKTTEDKQAVLRLYRQELRHIGWSIPDLN